MFGMAADGGVICVRLGLTDEGDSEGGGSEVSEDLPTCGERSLALDPGFASWSETGGPGLGI